jgi:NAD(P)-dependent dehydrogenase (short-subunit alcohol dehydrogenase family)
MIVSERYQMGNAAPATLFWQDDVDIDAFATPRPAATRNGWTVPWYPMCATMPPSSRVVQATFEAFGKVHIVRNNAGVNGVAGADNISLQDWSWVIEHQSDGRGAWREGIRAVAQGPRRGRPYRQHRLLVPAAKAFALYPSCESRGSNLRSRDRG